MSVGRSSNWNSFPPTVSKSTYVYQLNTEGHHYIYLISYYLRYRPWCLSRETFEGLGEKFSKLDVILHEKRLRLWLYLPSLSHASHQLPTRNEPRGGNVNARQVSTRGQHHSFYMHNKSWRGSMWIFFAESHPLAKGESLSQDKILPMNRVFLYFWCSWT